MRRTYSRERYLDRVAMIREHVPDCALTTDIIVGFPGETDADFEQTLEVAEEVGYDGAFTFIYSPRRGTEAATLPDQLPHELKVQRMERLVEVVQRRARERAQRFVGRTLDVLVEGPSRTDASRLRGRSRHNKVVNFQGLGAPGETVDVTITRATSQTLAGEASLLARAASLTAGAGIRGPRSWASELVRRICEHVFDAMEQPDHRGRAHGQAARLPGGGRGAPLRRAGGDRHTLLRGQGEVDPQRGAAGFADAVSVDDQSVPRVHARLQVLLRAADP